jgi:hypothetical protein
MHGFVRRPAFALVGALGVAAAYGAWHSAGGPLRSTSLAKPRVPAVLMADAAPARDRQADRAILGSPRSDNARCDMAGCADALAADAAEFCSVCVNATDVTLSGVDRSGLDGSGTSFGGASLAGFAPELQSDPNPIYLTNIEPSAVAAPTPEISTAAMLTLGFAGAFWAARRTGRAASKSSPEPRPC